MSTNLEIRREDRVLRLILNRPEKRNALSFALCRELVEAIQQAEQDAGIGAILVGANGPAFCAGMDLDEALAPDAAARAAIHEQLFSVGVRLTKPVVAAVHGPALGGGTGLVASAHIVVAAQGSTFGLTEIRLGMWPFVVYRAVALAIGERRALELSLTGRIFGAEEALQWGLVQQVVPALELEQRAAEVATGVAVWSQEAIRRGLTFVQQARGRSWEEAGALAASFREEAFRSPDFAEGVRAFQEKRAPRWRSQSPNGSSRRRSPGT
jgi:enoyl-CoA hydratase/carnithine racemase